jgi:hypothetical protein
MYYFSFFTNFSQNFSFLDKTYEVLKPSSNQSISDRNLLNWRISFDCCVDHFPNFSFSVFLGFIFPHDDSSFHGSCDHQASLLLIFDMDDFVVGSVLVEHGQNVVLVFVQVPETDHVLGRRSGQQTVADPNRTQLFRVTCD